MTEVIRQISTRAPRRAFLGVALLVLVVSATAAMFLQGHATAGTENQAIASVAETGKAFSAVTKQVAPAVVFIKAVKQNVMTGNTPGMNGFQGQIPDELLRRFFGDRMPDFPMPRQQSHGRRRIRLPDLQGRLHPHQQPRRG